MPRLNLTVKRAGLSNPQSKRKGYIARVVTNGTADYADIAAEAARNTTFNQYEIQAAGGIFCQAAAALLREGHIVDLGPLGRLYPSCQSAWHAEAAELTLGEIRPTVVYRPSDEIREAIRGAHLQWARGHEGPEDEDFAG